MAEVLWQGDGSRVAVAATIAITGLMDYDATAIPLAYDRARTHGPEVLNLWMQTVERYAGSVPLSTILDLGCGTGRFSDALATWFEATAIGVDPSRKMLDQARGKATKGAVQYVRGSGEALPLVDCSVDLVFMSMVFHHFRHSDTVVRECRRVLRAGAIVFLRAGTVEQIPAYPYVEFIPATKPLLYERLNAKRSIIDTFEAAGFFSIQYLKPTDQYRYRDVGHIGHPGLRTSTSCGLQRLSRMIVNASCLDCLFQPR